MNQDVSSTFKEKIEAGIQRDIDDVDADGYHEMTSEYLAGLKERFELSHE